MEQPEPETAVLVGAIRRPMVGPVSWGMAFGALTTAGLGALTGGLLVVHALAYGAVTVVAPDAPAAAPDTGRHALAFAVGVMVHVAAASVALWLVSRTTLRTWRPFALGLAASLVAATLAGCALLLALGISPAALVLDL